MILSLYPNYFVKPLFTSEYYMSTPCILPPPPKKKKKKVQVILSGVFAKFLFLSFIVKYLYRVS